MDIDITTKPEGLQVTALTPLSDLDSVCDALRELGEQLTSQAAYLEDEASDSEREAATPPRFREYSPMRGHDLHGS